MVEAVFIHCNQVEWQREYVEYFRQGFANHGIKISTTDRDASIRGAVNVVFANNSWKNTVAQCKKNHIQLITVNRCFFGSRFDMVAIGWDGFNGDADFCLNNTDDSRWKKHGFELPDWRYQDGYILVCGEFRNMESWYKQLQEVLPKDEVRFRPHPFVDELYGWRKAPGKKQDDIETALAGASICITYDSIAGCDAVLAGVPSITYGPKSMASSASLKSYEEWIDLLANYELLPDRQEWCNRLAYCQWSHQEIIDGDFWEHLKGKAI
jgi:hypothetical protein